MNNKNISKESWLFDLYKKLVVAFEAELNARNLKESRTNLGAETLEQKIAVFNVENPVVEDNLEIEVVKPTPAKKAKKWNII